MIDHKKVVEELLLWVKDYRDDVACEDWERAVRLKIHELEGTCTKPEPESIGFELPDDYFENDDYLME